ncbi:MAG TPA: hypothetical protein PKM88_02900 [bacterium]|nr:hypothetical protein [bacterium]
MNKSTVCESVVAELPQTETVAPPMSPAVFLAIVVLLPVVATLCVIGIFSSGGSPWHSTNLSATFTTSTKSTKSTDTQFGQPNHWMAPLHQHDTFTITDTVIISLTPLPKNADTAALLALIQLAEMKVGFNQLHDETIPTAFGEIPTTFEDYKLSDFDIATQYQKMPDEYEGLSREKGVIVILLRTINQSTVLAHICTPYGRDSSDIQLIVISKISGQWKSYHTGTMFCRVMSCG